MIWLGTLRSRVRHAHIKATCLKLRLCDKNGNPGSPDHHAFAACPSPSSASLGRIRSLTPRTLLRAKLWCIPSFDRLAGLLIDVVLAWEVGLSACRAQGSLDLAS